MFFICIFYIKLDLRFYIKITDQINNHVTKYTSVIKEKDHRKIVYQTVQSGYFT